MNSTIPFAGFPSTPIFNGFGSFYGSPVNTFPGSFPSFPFWGSWNNFNAFYPTNFTNSWNNGWNSTPWNSTPWNSIPWYSTPWNSTPWGTFGSYPTSNWNWSSIYPFASIPSYPTNFTAPINNGVFAGVTGSPWFQNAQNFPGYQNFPGFQSWNPSAVNTFYPGSVPAFAAGSFPWYAPTFNNTFVPGSPVGQNVPFAGIGAYGPASYPFNGTYGGSPSIRNNGVANPAGNPQTIREAA